MFCFVCIFIINEAKFKWLRLYAFKMLFIISCPSHVTKTQFYGCSSIYNVTNVPIGLLGLSLQVTFCKLNQHWLILGPATFVHWLSNQINNDVTFICSALSINAMSCQHYLYSFDGNTGTLVYPKKPASTFLGNLEVWLP